MHRPARALAMMFGAALVLIIVGVQVGVGRVAASHVPENGSWYHNNCLFSYNVVAIGAAFACAATDSSCATELYAHGWFVGSDCAYHFEVGDPAWIGPSHQAAYFDYWSDQVYGYHIIKKPSPPFQAQSSTKETHAIHPAGCS